MTAYLILTALTGIGLVRPGDDLSQLIELALGRADIHLESGDVLVVTQKVVSKAEGCLINLEQIEPSARAFQLAGETEKDARLVEVILHESRRILRKRPGLIIVEHRLGFICANAGIDHSNVAAEESGAGEWVLTLPKDPDTSARMICSRLKEIANADIGVLIIDSHGRAWRRGSVGVCIGVAGFPALLDLRGQPDLFGRPLQVTQVGLADEVAAAASLIMGQADESQPVVHIRGIPYSLREGSIQELLRPEEEDLFR